MVLPALPRVVAEKRPPRLRRPSRLPTGPRLYRLSTDPTRIVGPGEAPTGFVGATTSKSEWIIYWALAKVLGDPPDPRRPPYFGGRDWGYQIAALGAFTRQLGSAVIDFVVFRPEEQIGIRIQTSRFHDAAGPTQQGYDALQVVALGRRYRVIDIFEQDFIDDPTGQAAVVVVKEALGLTQRAPTISTGRSTAKG